MKIYKLTLILAAVLFAQAAFAQQSKSDPAVEFNPHWFGQIQGGAAYTFGETAFKNLLSPAAALSFGYQFSPTLGLRFGATGFQGKGNVVYPSEVYKFNYLQGNADLLLDLGNLIAGYDHRRVVSPYALLGGGAAFGFNNGAAGDKSHVPKDYFGHLWPDKTRMISPVGRWGIGTAIRLSEAVSLMLEVNGNVLSDKFNSKKVDRPDFQYNALAGLKVNLGKTTRPSAQYLADLAAAEAAAAAAKAAAERAAAERAAAERAAAERAAAEKAAAEKAAAERAAAERLAAEMRQVSTFFALDSDEIRPEEAARLERYVDWLKANPSVILSIAGYADEDTGTHRYNQKLSEKRAAVVRAFLVDKGIAPGRIISVVGNGDRIQPFEENDLNRVAISTVE